jgi:hypothetical protein
VATDLTRGQKLLGRRVRDVVTGFEGLVVACQIYCHEGICDRVLVEATLGADGKPRDPMWIDEPRVKIANESRGSGFVADRALNASS